MIIKANKKFMLRLNEILNNQTINLLSKRLLNILLNQRTPPTLINK